MNLEVQAKCEQLVEQFHDEFAELRRDVADTVQQVAQVWEGSFPDTSQMHGMLHCTSVRGLLLLKRVGVRNPDRDSPPGVVHTRYGQGMSVVVRDGRGMQFRVRKAPAEFFPERGERLVVRPPRDQREKAKQLTVRRAEAAVADEDPAQLSFGPGFDDLPRTSTNYEWFVLWTLSEDGTQVPDVFLAAVRNIDSASKVVILASTPLPRVQRPTMVRDEIDNDFEEFRDGQSEEGTGSAPA